MTSNKHTSMYNSGYVGRRTCLQEIIEDICVKLHLATIRKGVCKMQWGGARERAAQWGRDARLWCTSSSSSGVSVVGVCCVRGCFSIAFRSSWLGVSAVLGCCAPVFGLVLCVLSHCSMLARPSTEQGCFMARAQPTAQQSRGNTVTYVFSGIYFFCNVSCEADGVSLKRIKLPLLQCVCVSLFYVIDTGSIGSRAQ